MRNKADRRHYRRHYRRALSENKKTINGSKKQGDWREDVRHGRGVLTSGAKDFLYDGQWINDKRTGTGNCVIRGRETYSGLWKDGKFHGLSLIHI